MNKIITIIMYVLWIGTVIAILATTFTNFQYEDLNLFALVLFALALLNSFFVVTRRR